MAVAGRWTPYLMGLAADRWSIEAMGIGAGMTGLFGFAWCFWIVPPTDFGDRDRDRDRDKDRDGGRGDAQGGREQEEAPLLEAGRPRDKGGS